MPSEQFTRMPVRYAENLCMVMLLWTVAGSAGCSKQQAQTPPPAQEYPQFTIRMPEGWSRSESDDGMLLVATESAASEAELPRKSIVVSVARYFGRMTMELNWDLSIQSIEETVGPIEEHESGETVIDGRPWRWMIYSFESRSLPGVRLKCIVYSSFDPRYMYAITGGTSVEEFDSYHHLFEETARTFTFPEPDAPNGASGS